MPRKTKSGPQIKAVPLAGGRTRYRFTVDLGTKPKRDKTTGQPVLTRAGRQIMMRDQKTYTYDTLRQAREELAKIQADKARGTFVAPTDITVAELLAAYLDGRRKIRPNTLANYRNAVKPAVEQLGHVPVQKLTKQHVDTLVTWMLAEGRRVGSTGKPLSASTVNLMLTVLGLALDDAAKQGLIVRNVARLVDRPTVKQAEMSTWTAQQAQSFLAHVADDRLYVAWQLSLYGLRRGEVLGLRWEDLDLDAAAVTIRVTRVLVAGQHAPVHGEPKSERSRRTLPLDDTLVTALRRLKSRQAAERLAAGTAYAAGACADCGGRHVIVNELGDPVHPEAYSDRFEVLVRQAGLPRIRLHDCRHTAGTLMALRGVNAVVIASWLGHSKASFTMNTYIHSQADALRDAGNVLTSAYAG